MATNYTAKKTSCPITRSQFKAGAKALSCKLGEQPLEAVAKEFSTGSMGWYGNGKVSIPVEVDGKTMLLSCQVGLNITVIGSKELPVEQTTGGATVGAAS